MVDEFKKLRSNFEVTRKRFEKAKTLDEKHELLAISWEIIREAKVKIAEYRRQVSSAGQSNDPDRA
jgi:hypothetical protein